MAMKPEAEKEVKGLLRTSQVIVFALVSGVMAFAGYVVFIHDPGESEPQAQGGSELGLLMLGFAAITVVLRIVIPQVLVGSHRRKILGGEIPAAPNSPQLRTEEGWLMQGYQATTLVAGALLEVPAFANLFAYMQDQQLYSLIVAGLLLLGMIALFPSRARVDRWLENQLRLLEEERSIDQLAR